LLPGGGVNTCPHRSHGIGSGSGIVIALQAHSHEQYLALAGLSAIDLPHCGQLPRSIFLRPGFFPGFPARLRFS